MILGDKYGINFTTERICLFIRVIPPQVTVPYNPNRMMGLSQGWDHRWKVLKVTMHKRKKIREFDNRPLNTGSTMNSKLANQPTRRAPFACLVCYKKTALRWVDGAELWTTKRKSKKTKDKSSNYSGKFLSWPSEIVALRFLRIRPLTT